MANDSFSFYQFFLSFDRFGREYKLQHKGNDTFKTYYGAAISHILNIYLLSYIFHTFIPLMHRDIVSNDFQVVHRKDIESAFDPFQVGLTFAVGLDEELLASYGQFYLEYDS